MWAAIRDLPVTRIGHGVRSIEDPALVAELARRGTVLEVCPGSDVALGLYADRNAHPLRRLIEAGVRVTLLDATHQGEEGSLDHAAYMRDTVVPAMAAVREVADRLEGIVPDDLWPLPKYAEILFIK